jgi:hypothetical protein
LAVFFSHFSEISRVSLENPDDAATAEFVDERPTEADGQPALTARDPVVK